MKWLYSLFALVAVQAVSAAPQPESTLVKRASVNDIATVGYTSINGDTSGGSGGPVTRVKTLAALKTTVAGSAKKVVIVDASISGVVITHGPVGVTKHLLTLSRAKG